MRLAEFSSVAENEFGAALLGLIDEEYTDAEEALEDLCEVTGLDADDILDLIEGSSIPDEYLVEAFGNHFETTATDEEAFDGLVAMATEIRNEALENDLLDVSDSAIYAEDEDEYEDYEDEDEDEDYDDDNEDEYDEDLEDEEVETEASYSDARISRLENRIAEFNAAAAVNDALASAQVRAETGISEGWLPPYVASLILGDFDREADRLAAFSDACSSNRVTPDYQLFGMNFVLDVFEELGPMAQFSSYAEEVLTPREVEQEQLIANQASLNLEDYLKNR